MATTLPLPLKEDTLNQLINPPGGDRDMSYKPQKQTYIAFSAKEMSPSEMHNSLNT